MITREAIDAMGPWAHCVHLGNGLYTIPPEQWDEHVGALSYQHFIASTLPSLLSRLLPGSASETSVVDMGCMDGWCSLLMWKLGYRCIAGVDVDEENIARARFLSKHLGCEGVEFHVAALEKLRLPKPMDIGLMLGVLNHTAQPVELLRAARSMICDFLVLDLNIFVDRAASGLACQNSYLYDPTLQSNIALNFEKGGPFRHDSARNLVMQYDPQSVLMLLQYCGFHNIMEIPMPLATPSWMIPIRRMYVAFKNPNSSGHIDSLVLREAYTQSPHNYLSSEMDLPYLGKAMGEDE